MLETPSDRGHSAGRRGPYLGWSCQEPGCNLETGGYSSPVPMREALLSARRHAFTAHPKGGTIHHYETLAKMRATRTPPHAVYKWGNKVPQNGIGGEWATNSTPSTSEDNPYWFLPGAGN